MNKADRRDFEAHYEGPRDWCEFPELEDDEELKHHKPCQVKDRHTCGECDFYSDGKCWHVDPGQIEYPILTEPDDEACSDFEPRGGWQE